MVKSLFLIKEVNIENGVRVTGRGFLHLGTEGEAILEAQKKFPNSFAFSVKELFLKELRKEILDGVEHLSKKLLKNS